MRWVPGHRDARAVAAAMAAHHDRVWVMPFLPGRPCGIHGVVLSDGVVVLRPVEHVTVRAAREPRLRVVGTGTVWDPPDWARDDIRGVARRVGTAMGERVGFRSSFTLDGVLTAAGFRPTECNPRWGAASAYLHDALPDFPYVPLHYAVAADVPLDLPAIAVEAMLVAAAGARRGAVAVSSVESREPGSGEWPLSHTGDGWRDATGGEKPHALLTATPEATRWLVKILFRPELLSPGQPLAGPAVAALSWLDARYGAGIGPLIPGADPPARIRDATAGDVAGVAAMRAASWAAAYRGIVADALLDRMPGEVPQWMARLCPAAEGEVSLVADIGGRVVGLATGHPHRGGEPIAEVGLLYVAPHVWGRGIERALLAAVEDRLAGLGYDEAVLWTFEANDNGRAFGGSDGWRTVPAAPGGSATTTSPKSGSAARWSRQCPRRPARPFALDRPGSRQAACGSARVSGERRPGSRAASSGRRGSPGA